MVLTAAAHLTDSTARAEVSVEDVSGALRVEARDSTIAEILDALGASFDPYYRRTANLDQPISGIFDGSLSQIVSRILESYDYVATVSEAGQIEIVWIRLSTKNAGQAVAAVPTPVIERAASVLEAPNVRQLVASPRVRRLMAEHTAQLQRERASRLR